MNWPSTRVTELFGIDYPIIQAGMVWVSGAKLAAAASNAGCLGLIGAGSMKPELLKEHIKKAFTLTKKPFGVNVPLLYHGVEDQLQVALDEGVKIFFTSAGSPKKYTQFLRDKGCTVIHVTSTPELAKKCEDAGVHGIVIEGFEAGGHNGRDELTTLVLLQQTRVKIPIIAAGGIGGGKAMAAAFALGADAVQMGTVFAGATESSAHIHFKKAMCDASFNSTFLRMRKTVPVRLLDNDFSRQVAVLEQSGASAEELQELLGKGRAKAGMLEGDLSKGELEIGQIVSEVKEVKPVKDIVSQIVAEYKETIARLCGK